MHHNQFGAHEIMEAHEVITGTINAINTFDLLKQHVDDPQLSQIIERQTGFMQKEYNDMVSYLANHRGVTPETYHRRGDAQVNYGLRNPSPVSPHERTSKLNDREVASIMLGKTKCGASIKMKAALECADTQLRHLLTQGALSCAEQAYETFTYMNQKGMYQVPTMQQRTQNTFVNTFQPMGTQQGGLGANLGAFVGPGGHPGGPDTVFRTDNLIS